jgi:hypothetical protein
VVSQAHISNVLYSVAPLMLSCDVTYMWSDFTRPDI